MTYIEDCKNRIMEIADETLVLAREINEKLRPDMMKAVELGDEAKIQALNLRAQILLQSINEKAAEIEMRQAMLRMMGVK